MTTDHPLDRHLKRFPMAAAVLYVALLVTLVFVAWLGVATIVERRAAVGAASELLARLEGRRPPSTVADSAPAGPAPTGSPFLEGETVTVAGAALLQRVAGAVARVGGNVLSSQVDVQGPRSAEGYVSLIVSCEVEQASLQQVLYDLESGMPFLFIEQLVAQTTQAALASDGGRMRVLIAVSGQWEGTK